MQENQLFEYAVIRIVPKVEREEFLNVGVILYCGKQKFLQVKFHWDSKRISLLCPDLDMDELAGHLKAIERICQGTPEAGPIGTLPIAERFRWLTATRSTILQPSKVHPGFCRNAGEELQKLFEQMVL